MHNIVTGVRAEHTRRNNFFLTVSNKNKRPSVSGVRNQIMVIARDAKQ